MLLAWLAVQEELHQGNQSPDVIPLFLFYKERNEKTK